MPQSAPQSDRHPSPTSVADPAATNLNPTRAAAEALRAELVTKIEGEVRFDDLSRALYATDASVYQIMPAGVVIPRSRDDVIRTVQICGRHRCPITARGGDRKSVV